MPFLEQFFLIGSFLCDFRNFVTEMGLPETVGYVDAKSQKHNCDLDNEGTWRIIPVSKYLDAPGS